MHKLLQGDILTELLYNKPLFTKHDLHDIGIVGYNHELVFVMRYDISRFSVNILRYVRTDIYSAKCFGMYFEKIIHNATKKDLYQFANDVVEYKKFI